MYIDVIFIFINISIIQKEREFYIQQLDVTEEQLEQLEARIQHYQLIIRTKQVVSKIPAKTEAIIQFYQLVVTNKIPAITLARIQHYQLIIRVKQVTSKLSAITKDRIQHYQMIIRVKQVVRKIQTEQKLEYNTIS